MQPLANINREVVAVSGRGERENIDDPRVPHSNFLNPNNVELMTSGCRMAIETGELSLGARL